MIEVKIEQQKDSFTPGETISGRASWMLEEAPEALEIRLFWFTQGKGTVDAEIIDSTRIEHPSRSGEHAFSFTVPGAPFSFSGKLISLTWAVEAVALPSDFSGRKEVIIGREGKEIDLQAIGQ